MAWISGACSGKGTARASGLNIGLLIQKVRPLRTIRPMVTPEIDGVTGGQALAVNVAAPQSDGVTEPELGRR
jgi:hypothetical protein